MKYIMIFHSNLNYSQLDPAKFDWVCDRAYGQLAEHMMKNHPDSKWCYEASAWTNDYMAAHAPEALEKLKAAHQGGNCEMMTSPYAHSILTAWPHIDGVKSLELAQESWEKLFGYRPVSGWNPEGCWKSNIPQMYRTNGISNLVTDYDSYIQTKTGIRLPKTHTHSPDEIDKHLEIDMADPYLHKPVKIIDGVKGIMRTDRVSIRTLKYFIGEYPFDKLKEVIKRYSQGDGYLCVFAEDSEYIGTTAWYHLKYHGTKRLFEKNEAGYDRLAALVDFLEEQGGTMTCRQAAEEFDSPKEPAFIEDGFAWHHDVCTSWEETPAAVDLKPETDRVVEMVHKADETAKTDEEKKIVHQAWKHLVMGENSDGRWPRPPYAPADFNVAFCRDNLEKAAELIKPLIG